MATLSRFPTLSKTLFLLLLFFIPQQFGPHFWPSFAFVHGIRIDYLSPTVYISDILIILLFLTSAKTVLLSKQSKSFLKNRLFYLFVLILLLPLLYAYSPLSIGFALLKAFEMLFVGLYVASQITKKDIPSIIEVLTLTAVLEGLLGIAQFANQGSLGGVLYFFGERSYSLNTIGIAAMNTPYGLMVRPYGTFPHPNVLAFFLFATSVFVFLALKSTYSTLEVNSFFNRQSTKTKRLLKKLYQAFFVFSFVILQLSLLLTFSRTVLICDLFFLSYAFLYLPLKNASAKKLYLVFLVVCAIVALYAVSFNTRFLNFSTFAKDAEIRQQLATISVSAVRDFPLGLGLHNFYYYEVDQQRVFSSVYLQPVHNIFLLLLAETGYIGCALFVYFLALILLTLRKAVKTQQHFTFQKALMIILLSIILVGSFDHFFLTLQQGALLLSIILGLCYAKGLKKSS